MEGRREADATHARWGAVPQWSLMIPGSPLSQTHKTISPSYVARISIRPPSLPLPTHRGIDRPIDHSARMPRWSERWFVTET